MRRGHAKYEPEKGREGSDQIQAFTMAHGHLTMNLVKLDITLRHGRPQRTRMRKNVCDAALWCHSGGAAGSPQIRAGGGIFLQNTSMQDGQGGPLAMNPAKPRVFYVMADSGALE